MSSRRQPDRQRSFDFMLPSYDARRSRIERLLSDSPKVVRVSRSFTLQAYQQATTAARAACTQN